MQWIILSLLSPHYLHTIMFRILSVFTLICCFDLCNLKWSLGCVVDFDIVREYGGYVLRLDVRIHVHLMSLSDKIWVLWLQIYKPV